MRLPLLLAALAVASAGGAAAAERPNVIFVLADDLGWGDLGHRGHPYARTPHLDRLAAEGTSVANFYVNSTVCSPSRVAFMTGQYPARQGFHHITSSLDVNRRRRVPDWLDPDVPTVADVFRRAGYATAHFGKWHLGKYGRSPAPEAYGFDEALVTSGPGETLKAPGGEGGADPARMTAATFDHGLEFIRGRQGKPFYLNLWSPLPHAPLRMSAEQREPYGALVPDPAAFGPWMANYLRAARAPADQLRMYLAAVEDLDRHVGRLLAELARLGLERDTLIVFSSDNGPEDYYIGNAANAGLGSPGPFRGRKRSLYEGGVRVPFIVRWPGRIPAGRTDAESIVSGIDLLPTLAALAGVPLAPVVPGGTIDGEDLSAALRGQPAPRRRPLHFEWFFEVVGDRAYFPPPLAIRDGTWKFYGDYAGGALELYDVTRDPGETRNLAGDHPAVTARLRDAALAWVRTLPPAEFRDAVARGADRMTLLDIRRPQDRQP
ncbi:MAG: sulfatase-like hydrolase/transferase [Opitutaceae bacterium]